MRGMGLEPYLSRYRFDDFALLFRYRKARLVKHLLKMILDCSTSPHSGNEKARKEENACDEAVSLGERRCDGVVKSKR